VKRFIAVALAAEILLPLAPGISQTTAPVASVGAIQISSVTVAEISTTQIKAAVNLVLIPDRNVTVTSVQLCALRLNGLPVFASPIRSEIAVRKGQSYTLPPLYVIALFRDLTNTQPLRQMIENQSVHVQGELISGVELGMLERLALHAQHPKVVSTISEDVPVSFAGDALEKTLALTALRALDAALSDKNLASIGAGLRPQWVRSVEAASTPDLLIADSSYSVSYGNEIYPQHLRALGFRLHSGQIVTAADVLEPWKYDAEFLAALKNRSMKLVKGSDDIQLQPVPDGAVALRLSSGDFAVKPGKAPEGENVTAIKNGHEQVTLLFRSAPMAMTVLQPSAPSKSAGLAVAPAAVLEQTKWDQVVVFRIRTNPASGESRVEALQTGAVKDGSAIRLTDPVDDAVFGSPIVTEQGVIGMVQDERTGTFLPPELVAQAAPPVTQ
jgi:hypothetical protein